jgi:hypothetical protein
LFVNLLSDRFQCQFLPPSTALLSSPLLIPRFKNALSLSEALRARVLATTLASLEPWGKGEVGRVVKERRGEEMRRVGRERKINVEG